MVQNTFGNPKTCHVYDTLLYTLHASTQPYKWCNFAFKLHIDMSNDFVMFYANGFGAQHININLLQNRRESSSSVYGGTGQGELKPEIKSGG